MDLYFRVYDVSYRYPKMILDKTTTLIPSEQGAEFLMPQGLMIVVRHRNSKDRDSFIRSIYAVPKELYAPVRKAKDGREATIGYYKLPFDKTIYRVKKEHEEFNDDYFDSLMRRKQQKHDS